MAAADTSFAFPRARTFRCPDSRVDPGGDGEDQADAGRPELMAAHLDEWMKYWDANIRNRGKKQ